MDTESDELAAWIRRELGARNAAIERRLEGSSSASVYEVRIELPSGDEQLAIAKVFNRDVVSTAEATDHVTCEADRLRRAQTAGLPAPEPLIWDASGTSVGVPVIVMTRLPGEPLPRPAVPHWTQGFAETLVLIANADVDVSDLPLERHGETRTLPARTGSPTKLRGSTPTPAPMPVSPRPPMGSSIATSTPSTCSGTTDRCPESSTGLTGNGVGAGITLDGARHVLVDMTRRALRDTRAL